MTIQSLDKRLQLSYRMIWEDDNMTGGITNSNQPVIASSHQQHYQQNYVSYFEYIDP